MEKGRAGNGSQNRNGFARLRIATFRPSYFLATHKHPSETHTHTREQENERTIQKVLGFMLPNSRGKQSFFCFFFLLFFGFRAPQDLSRACLKKDLQPALVLSQASVCVCVFFFIW